MKKIFFRAAVVGTVILLGGCGGSSSSNSEPSGSDSYASEYPSEVEYNFVSNCSSTGGDEDRCQCVYDYIAARTPYDDFLQIDAAINAGGSVDDFDVFTDAVDECQ